MIRAGATHNVIPATGHVAGTVRMLDAGAWAVAEDLVRESVEQIVAPYGVTAEITYQRGVPPVVNDHVATTVLARAVERVLGTDGVVPTLQSPRRADLGDRERVGEGKSGYVRVDLGSCPP